MHNQFFNHIFLFFLRQYAQKEEMFILTFTDKICEICKKTRRMADSSLSPFCNALVFMFCGFQTGFLSSHLTRISNVLNTLPYDQLYRQPEGPCNDLFPMDSLHEKLHRFLSLFRHRLAHRGQHGPA